MTERRPTPENDQPAIVDTIEIDGDRVDITRDNAVVVMYDDPFSKYGHLLIDRTTDAPKHHFPVDHKKLYGWVASLPPLVQASPEETIVKGFEKAMMKAASDAADTISRSFELLLS